ncbi:DUF3329 domain-containing protein [Chelativorans salis]|uniref:DUF3329 domain-containing protein n=1 Tax=Chelativorans salis TaxID=2978478 RepID=A0ABT2LGZ3_9HYPH|nr:DUF3329 domain-containing protein [Chelativorans sp. EGI FJ00035]MCT7373805.1 DUF3329 domain-containing protein [Chelativorans sp. EGI FJ00035]
MQLFDADHPFFRPLWRRVAIVAVCLGWAAFEFASASPFWGALFGGVGVYCAWALLINYRPDTHTK